MKLIYHAKTDLFGEVEGFLDEDGKVLGMWCADDGQWTESMSRLLHTLGFSVTRLEGSKHKAILEEAAEKSWG